MTCKDCLHYGACLSWKRFEGEATLCQLFQDKSEWVHLPCKVGDTVYIASENRGVVESKVRTMFFGSNGVEMIRTEYCDIPFSNWGKTVFLTREEAERALAERSKE